MAKKQICKNTIPDNIPMNYRIKILSMIILFSNSLTYTHLSLGDYALEEIYLAITFSCHYEKMCKNLELAHNSQALSICQQEARAIFEKSQQKLDAIASNSYEQKDDIKELLIRSFAFVLDKK